MTTQAVNLYEVLKHNLNDTGAKAVVQYIEEYMEVMVSKHVDTKIALLATKDDLVQLELRIDRKIINLKDDLNQLEVKLVKMIMDTKAELMKWMFIFITGQTVVLAGLLKLFLKS